MAAYSSSAWARSSGSSTTCSPRSTAGSCHGERAARRYAGTGALTPGAGSGRPGVSRSGTTPAQYGSASSAGSSLTPPVRTRTDTSRSGSASTAVSASSRRFGGRLSAERPVATFSTSAVITAAFSSASSTSRAVPCATTDR